MSASNLILTNNDINQNLYDSFINVFLQNIRDSSTKVISSSLNLLEINKEQNVYGTVVIKNNNEPVDSVYEKKQLCNYESAIISDAETVNHLIYIANKYPLSISEFKVIYNGIVYKCDLYVVINGIFYYVLNLVN